MNDLDTALRTMLQERAHDITTLPSEFGDLRELSETAGPDDANVVDLLDRRPVQERHTPRRSTWLVAAAVAAVLAVGGTMLALDQGGRHDRRTPPAQQSTNPRPTVSSTPKPVAVRTTCTVAEPAAWRSAFSQTNSYGAQGAKPLTFAGSDLVVARDFGSSRDVALVSPNGSTRTVYSVPDPDRNEVLSAAVDGNRLLMPVSNAPRNSNGVLPSVVRIDVVDLDSKAVSTVTTAPITIDKDGQQRRVIDGATLYRGTVYYDVKALYTDRTARIHAYDLTTRADRVVGTSTSTAPEEGPVVLARGVFWSQNDPAPAVAATLPAAVSDGLTTSRARSSLVTDGTTYAWSPSPKVIAVWQPGASAPSQFGTAAKSALPVAVAGRVVVFTDTLGDGSQFALDTRSAGVTVETGVAQFGASHAGVLSGYPDKSGSAVVRVDTTTLPKLTC